jgi:hypothetical protein
LPSIEVAGACEVGWAGEAASMDVDDVVADPVTNRQAAEINSARPSRIVRLTSFLFIYISLIIQ